MRLSGRLLVLSLASCAPAEVAPAQEPDFSSVLTETEKRDDPLPAAIALVEHREIAGNLDRADALLEWHLVQQPDRVPWLVLLAEAHSRALENLDVAKPSDAAPHRRHRTAGVETARRAAQLAPDDAAAHYWLGCLLLHTADAERSYSTLKLAIPELLKAHQLGPKVDSAGPSRMLGRIYQETPGGFLLGSKPKAIDWYRKSLALVPDFITTLLWLGETYSESEQPESARVELTKVANATPRPGHEREDNASRARAEELLKKLSSK